jgi:hypothetical protein
MRRLSVFLGVLGLVCAVALPASAQKQIKIFGQNYNVVAQSRGQTYKNGVAINLDDGVDGVNRFAGVYFAEGPDRATDRLWFTARIDNNADSKGDQLYYLEGSDANGNFTAAVSNAKSFFGGNVDQDHGGRPVNMVELNRDDTGVKKDRNILVTTFFDDDAFRMYDLDSMNSDRITDALFSRVKPSQAPSVNDAGDQEGDANLPKGDFPSFALLPTSDGHTVLAFCAPGDNGEATIGIWDTRQDTAFPVLTDVSSPTQNATKKFPIQDADGNNLAGVQIVRYGNQGEYWFLLDQPSPGGSNDTERTAVVLVRATLQLPADPSKAKPGDIKVTVLDTQDLMATAGDILFPKGTAGMTGVTVGREVTPGGPRVLYTSDYDGNFYTLTPAQ